MDKIMIRGLRANAIIGTLGSERVRRQEVRVTLELELDLSRAGASDDLADSVDYSEIERRALELVENSRFQLMEALGAALGRLLLEYAAVKRATVRLAKPHALRSSEVEIVMEFERGTELS